MPSSKWENFFINQGLGIVAGVDEVGRGPLAGPVVAAAVILSKNKRVKGINDSKKLSAKARNRLFKKIKAAAVSIGVGIIDHKTIDQINIAQATFAAMRLAIECLNPTPDVLLIDGKCEINSPIPQKCIVRGDSICRSIAAASIIAKVIRDKIMEEYGTLFPEYNFKKHKGYGTASHISALLKLGPCAIHRQSFISGILSPETLNPLDFEQTPLIDLAKARR